MSNYRSLIRAELAANRGAEYTEPTRYSYVSGSSDAWGEVDDVRRVTSYEEEESSFWGSDNDDDEMNCVFF